MLGGRPSRLLFLQYTHVLGTFLLFIVNIYNKVTLWPESASKLYQLSTRRFSEKLEPTFADRGCHVVNAAVFSDF
jgi:hypothetical protein